MRNYYGLDFHHPQNPNEIINFSAVDWESAVRTFCEIIRVRENRVVKKLVLEDMTDSLARAVRVFTVKISKIEYEIKCKDPPN